MFKIDRFKKFLNEATLSNTEMLKYTKRPELFYKKYVNGEPFELKDGTMVVLNNTSKNGKDNLEKIKNSIQTETPLDWNSLTFDIKDGDSIKITQFKKSADFGGRSGEKDAGKSNEFLLHDKLVEYIKQYNTINIIFQAKNKDLIFDNITAVKNTSLNASEEKDKADLTLVDNSNKNHGLSLKQDDAGYYESADTIFKAILIDLAKKIKANEIEGVTLTKVEEGDKKDNWMIKPEIAVKVPERMLERVVFGTKKTDIIKKTFKDTDFTDDNGTITIKCSKIISSLDDIEDNEEPIIIVRNNTNRNKNNPDIRGLRIAVVPKGTRKASKLIDYKVKE